MGVIWCSFCCPDAIVDRDLSDHALGEPCPQRTTPCTADGCRNGDHHCVTGSLTNIGCEDCRWTGYCPACKGCGDARPLPHHRREYQNEARRAKRRMAHA